MCFLEVCLQQNGVEFERTLYADTAQDEMEQTLVAEYGLRCVLMKPML